MIDMPAKDIKAKIIAAKGLTEQQVDAKIKEKLKQLAGLISEDGAAHIVANELGVELVKAEGPAKINDLYLGMKNVTVTGKVTQKYELREFDKNGRQGKVASFMLGDDSGNIRITLWNDQTNPFNELTEGDTIRIKNAYVKDNRGNKELHLGNDAKLEINPAGVVITNVQTRAAPTMERKMIRDLTGDEANVELLATIVQVYDPRFFDVDASGKRLTPDYTGVKQTNYVMNVFLDDGSGNIRTTFWKDQAQAITGKTHEEFLHYMTNPNAFEEVKTDLLGEIIKITGRCKKNEQFERIELTANTVLKNVDPEEELKKLNEGLASDVTSVGTKQATSKVAVPAEPKEAPAAPARSKQSQRPSPTLSADDDDDEDDDKEEETEREIEERDEPVEKTFAPDKEVTNNVTEEEIISLDDLEDLDEKL